MDPCQQPYQFGRMVNNHGNEIKSQSDQIGDKESHKDEFDRQKLISAFSKKQIFRGIKIFVTVVIITVFILLCIIDDNPRFQPSNSFEFYLLSVAGCVLVVLFLWILHKMWDKRRND